MRLYWGIDVERKCFHASCIPLHWGERTQERSVPLASLGLGSSRPLVSLVKFTSGKFRIRDGKHEAYRLLGEALRLGDER